MAELRSNTLTITAVVAAIGFAVKSLGGAAAADPGTHVTATASASGEDAPAGLAPERLDHMGTRLLAEAEGDTMRPLRLHSRGAAELGVMVATIPDPLDSHEDWAYDANLEAIRRAHEEQRYTVLRMWLPWALGGDSLVADSAKTRLRRAYPGVLLFRSADTAAPTSARPRYRLVYLVGEVPTAGVHAVALIRALAERDLLLGRYAFSPVGRPVGGDTLHLLGPTFSGSAPALAELLRDKWVQGDTTRTVSVITGSATAAANRTAFSRRPFTFAATVNSDDALRAALAGDVLKRLRIQTNELAVLVEGSTAYGRDWEQADSAKPGGAAAVEKAAGDRVVAGREKSEAAAPPAVGLKGAITLTFPMNVGTLRDEYADRLREARRATQGPDQAVGPAVSLTDATRPMETAPVASRLTASAVDLMLDEIASTLRSHDIRAVAVAASDVRDRLFLVSELRTRLRDVQFIALENNALYLTPEYNRDLRGMLVVSSYPLLPETQLWGGGHQVVPFAGEFAEGVYNAALMHLGSHDLLDYAYPDSAAAARHPPVWITAVGSGALVPLRADTAGLGYATSVDSVRIPAAVPEPRFDFLSGVLVAAILAAAAWLLYAVLGHWTSFSDVAAADNALLQGQLDALEPALKRERARRPRKLVRLGNFLGVYGWQDPAAPRVESATASAAEAVPVVPVVTDAAEDDEWLRPVLSRYGDWATLRCQEALYRLLFAAAVLGGLLPGTVLFGAATLRSSPALRMPAIAASALLVAAAVAALAHRMIAARRGTAATRRANRYLWTSAGLLGAATVFGMGQVAWAHGGDTERATRWGWWTGALGAAHDDWIRAGAVVTAAAAVLVLLGALGVAAGTLVRTLRHYRVTLAACSRVNAGMNLWRLDLWLRHGLQLLGAVYAILTAAYAVEIAAAAAGEPVTFTLLFHRGWRVDGGMSPLFPLGLAALAFTVWARWHLRRIRTLRQVTSFEAVCLAPAAAPANGPAAADDPDAAEWESAFPRRAVEGVRQVRERLTRLVPDPGAVVLAVVLLACAACIALTRYQSMERVAGMRWFDGLYRFGLIAMVATTAWGVYRLLAVWMGLHRTLRAMAGTPLVTAFERLPRRISRLTRLVFLGTPRSAVVAPVAAAQWRHLASLSVQLDPDLLRAGAPAEREPVPAGVSAHASGDGAAAQTQASHGASTDEREGAKAQALAPEEAALRRDLRAYIKGPGAPAMGLGDWGQESRRAENLRHLGNVLEALWRVEPRALELKGVVKQVEEQGAGGEPAPSTSGRIRRTTADGTALWFRAAEEFAAVQVVDYVESVINQMRVLALFIFASLLLVTLHEGAYPYQPQSLVKLILFALLVCTVGALVKVMLEMNRDEILSRIAHTEPGKVTWDMHFVLNLAVFGVVPLVSLVGSEFPAVREFLLAWLYPITRLLGGGG